MENHPNKKIANSGKFYINKKNLLYDDLIMMSVVIK